MTPRPLFWLALTCSLLPTAQLDAQTPPSVDSTPPAVEFPWGGLQHEGTVGTDQDKDVVEVRAEAVKVGLVGDPRQVLVEGAEAILPEDIARALGTDLAYQAAARPSSSLITLIDVLRDRVLVGLQHSGFGRAAATARYDSAADALVVQIEEGQRGLAGAIRVTGAKQIDAERVAKLIGGRAPGRSWVYWHGTVQLGGPASNQETGDKSPWIPGKPAPFDSQTLETIAKQAKLHFADIGFPFAKFRVEVEPTAEGTSADLVIKIDDEGPHATIDEVMVVGLTRHSQEQVSDYLKVRVGDPLDAAVCSRVVESLRDSCRFWKYRLDVQYPADIGGRYGGNAPRAKLAVTVIEYESAPTLDEPLPEVDQCLVRTANWLKTFWTEGGDDEFVYEGGCPVDDKWSSSVGEMRVVLSRKQGCLATMVGEFGEVKVDAAAVIRRDEVSILDWQSGKRLSGEHVAIPRFTFDLASGEIGVDGAHRCALKVGLGMNSSEAGEWSPAEKQPDDVPKIWTANIEPVAVIQSAHRPGTTTSIEDGVLSIKTATTHCRIDVASGRILTWDYIDQSARWTLRVSSGEFDKAAAAIEMRSASLEEMYDPDAPLVSIARFGIASLSCQKPLQDAPLTRLACERGDALLQELELKSAIQAVTDEFWERSRPSRERTFGLPPYPARMKDDDWGKFFVYVAPQIADATFPRGSWPWTGIREYAFLMADDWQSGPLTGSLTEWNGGYWAENLRVFRESSQLVRFAMIAMHDDEMGRPFAKWALDLPEKDLSSEIHAILHGEHLFSQGIPAGVSVLESMDETAQATLASELDWPWSQAVSQLIERRAQKPDEPPDQALEAVLIAAWKNGGQAAIQDALKSLAGPSDTADETMAAGDAAELTK
jgi:hypothetical protein